MMTRREILLAPAAAMAQPAAPRFVKSICSVIFPNEMPIADRFRQARQAGFEAIELRLGGEIPLGARADEVKTIGDQARKAGIAIASLWVADVFSTYPLNDPDPVTRAKGVDALHQAIDFATWLGCGALLLVPGRLGSGARFKVGYQDTWRRFTDELEKVIPAAEKAKVLLTPENVWNKFLVSPLEMRSFVDQFHSPWLQSHFDVGNVMQYGYPQDWILTLGPRIRRVHLKDYKLSARAEQGRFVDLMEGDVDWKEVMAAFVKTGYRGPMSPEYGYDPADPAKLEKISRTVDRIFALA